MACSVALSIYAVSVILINMIIYVYGRPSGSCDTNVIEEPDPDPMPCGRPQPRAFLLRDLIDDAVLFEKPFVVLHRCHQSGCCHSNESECTATNSTTFQYSYNFYYQNGEEGCGEITLINDTACECRQRT